MTEVFIDSIAYVTGQPVALETLAECRESPQNLQVLQQEGYEQVLVSRESVADMAMRSLRKTLEQGDIDPADIDLLIYSSDSAGDQRERECNSQVHRISLELGLENAYPLGINQSTCGNFCSSLRVAAALLKTGETRNVLLVTAEKSENGERIMDSNAAVLSDGAASCLVTTSGRARYRLAGIVQSTIHALGCETEAGSKVFLALSGFQSAFEKFTSRLDLEAEHFSQLIPNNYNRSLLSLYAQISGIGMDKVYDANLKSKAHVYSCDNLINLLDYSGAARLQPGDKIAMLGNGPSNWGLTALEVQR